MIWGRSKHGPFLGYQGPYCDRDPKKDHTSDNLILSPPNIEIPTLHTAHLLYYAYIYMYFFWVGFNMGWGRITI